jgi:hypothetical protein
MPSSNWHYWNQDHAIRDGFALPGFRTWDNSYRVNTERSDLPLRHSRPTGTIRPDVAMSKGRVGSDAAFVKR